MNTPVWDAESIRLVKSALAAIAFSQRLEEGRHLDDPWNNEPPLVEDQWVGTVEMARLLDEDVFPGKEVDEPFLERFKSLVEIGRAMETRQ